MKSFSALIIIQLNYNPYSAYWVCIYVKKFIISDKRLLDALLGILGAMWELINRMSFISCALPNSEITYDWIHTVHALKHIVCELMITVPLTVLPCDLCIIHNAFVVIQSSHMFPMFMSLSINTQVMDGHASRVFSLKYHPTDPHMLISGGWDDTVQVCIAYNPSLTLC